MIEVKDLVKKYGDHVAVDHLSFTIEKGKIYGFLGPNGAGKSTTMTQHFRRAGSRKKMYRLSAGATSGLSGHDSQRVFKICS